VPPPANPTASDNCDPDPSISFDERRIDGNCPDNYTLVRTWTATDRCSNSDSQIQRITVEDTTAPTLSGVPGDTTVECDAVPPPANPTASDNCDPSPRIAFDETRIDGICPDNYTLVRTWTATDRCGNSSSQTQTITVEDTTPPILVGVPPDETLECDSVPTPPTVTAIDNCDPAPTVSFSETRIDGHCPGYYTLYRTWTATDRCGNSSSQTQTIEVVDTTPPVITPGEEDLYCLWPPNHRMVCFTQDMFDPEITENCSFPISWQFEGCPSDEPDNGPTPGGSKGGDGHTLGDCYVSPDGTVFCVRAERSGVDEDERGRRYSVVISATDACSNTSPLTQIGYIHVPHQNSGHLNCLNSSKLGLKQKEPLPGM
jgi:hypothetical protein